MDGGKHFNLCDFLFILHGVNLLSSYLDKEQIVNIPNKFKPCCVLALSNVLYATIFTMFDRKFTQMSKIT